MWQVRLRAPPYSMRLIDALGFVLCKFPIALPRRYGYKALGLALLVALWGVLRASGLHVVWLRQLARALLAALGPE